MPGLLSLQDPEYLDFISDESKARTAQEVICFMYKLNSKHVLAHLEGERDVENNIINWLKKKLKSFILKNNNIFFVMDVDMYIGEAVDIMMY